MSHERCTILSLLPWWFEVHKSTVYKYKQSMILFNGYLGQVILAKILDAGINGPDKTLEHLSIDFPVLWMYLLAQVASFIQFTSGKTMHQLFT